MSDDNDTKNGDKHNNVDLTQSSGNKKIDESSSLLKSIGKIKSRAI